MSSPAEAKLDILERAKNRVDRIRKERQNVVVELGHGLEVRKDVGVPLPLAVSPTVKSKPYLPPLQTRFDASSPRIDRGTFLRDLTANAVVSPLDTNAEVPDKYAHRLRPVDPSLTPTSPRLQSPTVRSPISTTSGDGDTSETEKKVDDTTQKVREAYKRRLKIVTLGQTPTTAESGPLSPKSPFKRSLFSVKRDDKHTRASSSPDKEETIQAHLERLARLAEKESITSYLTMEKWEFVIDGIEQFATSQLYHPNDWRLRVPHSWFDQLRIRNLELEGFYVSSRPDIAPWNLEKMVGRLIVGEEDGGKDWFGPDFNIITQTYPTASRLVRLHPAHCPSDFLDFTPAAAIRSKAFLPSALRRIQDTSYLLILSFSNIAFHSHPLMNKESFIAKELEALVEQWEERRKSDVVGFLSRKLSALREGYKVQKKVYDKLLEVGEFDSPVTALSPTFYARHKEERRKIHNERLERMEKNLQSLLSTIKNTRLLRDTEEQMNLVLEFKIAKTWDALKSLREKQGYTSTDTKLAIRYTEADITQDQEQWKKDIKEELWEMTEEKRLTYNGEMRVYNDKLEAWNQRNHKMESIDTGEETESGRKTKRRKGEVECDDETEKKEEDPVPQMPELPEIDKVSVKNQIKQRLGQSRRQIGSPHLTLAIIHNESITEHISCPRDEQHRRRMVEDTQLYVVVYLNGREVTRTLAQSMKRDFVVPVAGVERDEPLLKQWMNRENHAGTRTKTTNVFGVRVFEEPESIKLDIMEVGALGDRVVAEVFVPIPNASDVNTANDKGFENLQFSGLPFTPQVMIGEKSVGEQYLGGLVKLHTTWGTDEHGNVLGPVKKASKYDSGKELSQPRYDRERTRVVDPYNSIGPCGFLNLRKLLTWISNQNIDPNDPRNSRLLQLKSYDIESFARSLLENWNRKLIFRLTIPKRILETALGLGYNERQWVKRQKLLRSRHDREIIAKTPIPLKDTEIVESQFERLSDVVNSSYSLNQATSTEPKQLGFLKRIRAHALLSETRQKSCRRFDDIIRETRIPLANPDTNIFGNLFKVNRPLRPERKDRMTLATETPEKAQIVVKVASASNIPTRKTIFKDSSKTQNVTVRPYLEIHFMGHRAKTTVSEGPNPIWNENVSLPFIPPLNDYTPDALIENGVISEVLYIHLFDEVLVDIQTDERDRDTKIMQRRERRWLGSVQVPFATIYERARVEGLFQVKVPHSFLGYEKPTASTSRGNDVLIGVDSTTETTVQLFITLEPPLATPKPLKLKFASDEDSRMLRYASDWCKSPVNGRVWKATSLTLNGKTTLLTRFIRPQAPPKGIDTPEKATRFVSLIPCLSRSSVLGGQADIWCTSKQLLDIGAGDHDEHAILLCNYLLYLKHEAFVVLGQGIPEGRTAYVLYIQLDNTGSRTFYLINAVTGEWFRQGDAHCPLRQIGTIFDARNVWANVGLYDDPARCWLAVSDSRYWKPLFSRTSPKTDTTSIQTEIIVYKTVTDDSLRQLEKSIEKTLVKNMEEWRPRQPTRWNRMCSRMFSPVLKTFEQQLLNHAELPSLSEISPDWSAVSHMYRITGFPLNVPYTDLNAIVEAVRATDVFRIDEDGVEFALAVHCVGYIEGVISVWVWIGSLSKNM